MEDFQQLGKTEQKEEVGTRLEFTMEGDRADCFRLALKWFEHAFKDGWRLAGVCEELDTSYGSKHPNEIADDDWLCKYEALGVLKDE